MHLCDRTQILSVSDVTWMAQLKQGITGNFYGCGSIRLHFYLELLNQMIKKGRFVTM